jgi:hypothetical protein
MCALLVRALYVCHCLCVCVFVCVCVCVSLVRTLCVIIVSTIHVKQCWNTHAPTLCLLGGSSKEISRHTVNTHTHRRCIVVLLHVHNLGPP